MNNLAPKPKKPRLFAVFAVIGFIAVVIGVAGTQFLRQRDDIASVFIPSPKMPSPNAYDYFVRAQALIVNRRKIIDALIPIERGSNNAQHPYSQAQMEALVRENTPALRMLRQGFQYPSLVPPVRSFRASLRTQPIGPSLVALLLLEGQTYAEGGRWDEAAQSDLDAVQFGVLMSHGSTITGTTAWSDGIWQGDRALSCTYPHLNAAQSRVACRRLESFLSQESTLVDALQEEKWKGLAALREITHPPDWRHHMADALAPHDPSREQMLEAEFNVTPKRRYFENYAKYMDGLTTDMRQPYTPASHHYLPPQDPLISLYVPDYDWAGQHLKFAYELNRTRRALLLLTLAIHAYRMDHGDYPPNLSVLSPVYLTAIPADPFACSGTIHYLRRRGSEYLLYSIGPDGEDDGGTAAFDPSQPAPSHSGEFDVRHMVSWQSQGDIVAGISYY